MQIPGAAWGGGGGMVIDQIDTCIIKALISLLNSLEVFEILFFLKH